MVGAKIRTLWLVVLLTLSVTACGVPENSIGVKTAREAAAANCDQTGKCVKDPSGLVLYNSDLVTENFVLKRQNENQTLLTKLFNLIDEPKLLVTAKKLEPLMLGVAIVGESEPCDSPKGIDGSNPTAGQLRSLKQGRYKACITYIGDGLFKKAYALSPIDVDTTPPDVSKTVLNNPAVTPTTASLSWSKGGDNLTLDGKLIYAVYTSKTNVLDSLEAVRAHGNLVPGLLIGGISYTITSLSENTNYHAAVVVTDQAGNQSLVGNSNFRTTASDVAPPLSPSLVINSADSHASTASVTLTLSADEASEMYVTNSSGCASDGSWEAYGTSKSWTLGQLNATAVVYAKFKDTAGNETACVSDTIIHDSTVPLTPVISDAAKSFNASFATSIQQNIVPDANFKEFRYTTTGVDPTCSTGTVSSTQPTSVTILSATTTLKAISCDQAGNISPVATSVYTYDITPPNAPMVTGTTPTSNTTPTWTWTSGGGGGNATFRYRLNNSDMSTGTTTTTSLSYTPGSALSEATHTIYVQESDAAGNWSTSGSFAIQVVTPPAAPTLATPTRYETSLGLSWASVTGATSYNLYWSTTAELTTASTKISNVSSVYTHTPLSGGVTHYYKLAAVKNGVESALSNEVSAVPYSFAAPTVTAISPSSGSTSGGTAVSITGTGFVSGATVSIGGASATGVTVSSATSIIATTPAGTVGAQDVVVGNPDGQTGTLIGGYAYYMALACSGDCYLEGGSPNFAQDLAIDTERQGPSGTTLTLRFANDSSGFKIWKEKGGNRILNASGLVSNGWQQTLTRAGTAFSGSDMTNTTYISQIAGRACPTNVFLDHRNMTATNRCLYYDSINPPQSLNVATGVHGQDFVADWNTSTSGRGVGSSYYEGNIKTCADKGMRLPSHYEMNFTKPTVLLPTGDLVANGGPLSSDPVWPGTSGVPSTVNIWTASARLPGSSGNGPRTYFAGPISGPQDVYTNTIQNSVRCVLPNNIAPWTEVTVGSDITMRDNATGLWWSNDREAMDWYTAMSHCEYLSYNGAGAGSWRLPTFNELFTAYDHGINTQGRTGWITNFDSWFFSSTIDDYTPYPYVVNLADKWNHYPTDNANQVVCVR